MEKTCIDTNVLIEMGRRKLISIIDRDYGFYIPSIVLYEYLRGLVLLGRDPDLVKYELEQRFNIIWLDNRVLKIASKIYAKLYRNGQLIPDPDILIAASCILYKIPLATYNIDHFKRIDELKLKDPTSILSELEEIRDMMERTSA